MASERRLEAGQDIVEYALILPFLLLLTFSIIEGGWLVFRYNTVANAAREGARAGIVPEVSAGEVEAAALNLTVGLVPVPTVVVSSLSPSSETVSVTVTYDAPLITGSIVQALGGEDSVRLEAVATMQRE